MKSLKRKHYILITLLLVVVIFVGLLVRPSLFLLKVASKDKDERTAVPEGYADDASRLNLTPVKEVWQIPIEDKDAEGQIAALLARAKTEGLRVSIAGAQHSMGGHSIYPGGIVLKMSRWNKMELKSDKLLLVQAGATWKEVIAYLDKHGLSVEVMQSNNSFSVGGSISANCHGWQYDRAPIASTVESFRLMKADGSIVRCNRSENKELFSLVLGGYGLFGIILDVELRIRKNGRYRLERYVVPTSKALATLDNKISGKEHLEMVYARMNVAAEGFLQEVIINGFFSVVGGDIPRLGEVGSVKLKRTIFRGSAEGEYGKTLRWEAETHVQPLIENTFISRNQILNVGVEIYENRSANSTDILHEYFVPRRQLAAFVASIRSIIPKHQANLLNITIRAVNEDKDSYLRYASEPMVALVMLYLQEKTSAAEAAMQTFTRDMIEAALQHEGCYYLPYRLHASRDQFERAYPMAQKFFEKKRAYDPDELFQNKFYLKYGKPSQPAP